MARETDLTTADAVATIGVMVLEKNGLKGEIQMSPVKHLDQPIQSAFRQLLKETGSSVDTIPANPVLRGRFLELTGHHTGCAEEEAIFLRLLALRKKKGALPRE